MKTPLSGYIGGKSRMRERLLDIIVPAEWDCYVEPFCGGAAVFFGLWERVGDKRFYFLNDNMELIVNFFREAKSRPDALIKMADERLIFAQSQWAMARDIILADGGGHSDVERAWAVWYKVATSFGGMIRNGGGFQGNVNQSHVNFPHLLVRKADTIAACARALQSATICQEDAVKLIGRYDRPGAMFFCDPPYVDTFQGHYDGYSQAEFDALLNALRGLRGLFVMTTYENDALAAASAECGWRTIRHGNFCPMSSSEDDENRRTEVVTTNLSECDGRLI